MKDTMAMNINGTEFYIGESYNTIKNKLLTVYDVKDIKEHIENKTNKRYIIAEFTEAYFDADDNLERIGTDIGGFEGYSGEIEDTKFNYNETEFMSGIERLTGKECWTLIKDRLKSHKFGDIHLAENIGNKFDVYSEELNNGLIVYYLQNNGIFRRDY